MPTFEHLVLDGRARASCCTSATTSPPSTVWKWGWKARAAGLEASPLAHLLPHQGQRRRRALPRYALTDVSFLGGLLLQAAGPRPRPSFGANVRLREACAGRFLECPDAATLQSYYAEVFDRQGVLAR